MQRRPLREQLKHGSPACETTLHPILECLQASQLEGRLPGGIFGQYEAHYTVWFGAWEQSTECLTYAGFGKTASNSEHVTCIAFRYIPHPATWALTLCWIRTRLNQRRQHYTKAVALALCVAASEVCASRWQ